MPRAKIWLDDVEHLDNRSRWATLAVGEDCVLGVSHGRMDGYTLSRCGPGHTQQSVADWRESNGMK